MDASCLFFLHFLSRKSRIVCLALVKRKPPGAVTQHTWGACGCTESQQNAVPWLAWACPRELPDLWRNGVVTQERGGLHHTILWSGSSNSSVQGAWERPPGSPARGPDRFVPRAGKVMRRERVSAPDASTAGLCRKPRLPQDLLKYEYFLLPLGLEVR